MENQEESKEVMSFEEAMQALKELEGTDITFAQAKPLVKQIYQAMINESEAKKVVKESKK